MTRLGELSWRPSWDVRQPSNASACCLTYAAWSAHIRSIGSGLLGLLAEAGLEAILLDDLREVKASTSTCAGRLKEALAERLGEISLLLGGELARPETVSNLSGQMESLAKDISDRRIAE